MKKYNIIYADPPWPHRSGSRHKVVPYPTMTIKQISRLPIDTLTQKNAVLLLWTTDKYLQAAMQVMRCWGFEYKTVVFVWVKQSLHGCLSLMVGGWTVKCVELCLLATKGRPHKLLRCRSVPQLLTAKTRGHSTKPKEARERIELMFPKANKLELFARKKSPGWDVWGNEVESDVEFS